MKKLIFKFQQGTYPNWWAKPEYDFAINRTSENEIPEWYKNLYAKSPYNEDIGDALGGWNSSLDNTFASNNLKINGHGNALDLTEAWQKNKLYTDNSLAITNDIQTFYNSDGNKMSAEDFVKFYNSNAEKIRQHWATSKLYGSPGAKSHNLLFRKMFASRSNTQGSAPYNIGYQEGDIEDIEGSSTWLRRMDSYEKDYDKEIPQSRLHTITLSDGNTATFYKKANGDIALFKTPTTTPSPELSYIETPNGGSVNENHTIRKPIDLTKLTSMVPDILEAGRLAGSLNNNERVYLAALKGIRPNLQLTYNTHRQVVGDEATKLSYYRMAAQGQTKAAKPFTSDADKQIAYMMEAKRVGDELRAKGDLVDNTEIRRTSDESNQHQWANIKRANEVAAANNAQLNAANASRLNILAQKYSADWTSWDNYLKSKETRMRAKLAENNALQKQIGTLQYLMDYANDETLLALKKAAEEAYDSKAPDAQEKIRKYNNYKTQKAIEYYKSLQNPLLYGKSGVKMTYKNKEDLLYKSARDAVEHFRKMVKMSDDSTLKSRKNPIKLTSYPKTKKMLQGGVAPFTIFTPAALGGETSSQSTAASSSNTTKKDSDSDDFIKSLLLKTRGLPVDVNLISTQIGKVLQRAYDFGETLTSRDMETLQLQALLLVNNAEHSKLVFDEAKKVATNNDALGEFAVTSGGLYIVLDSTGKIGTASIDQILAKKLNPLTNGQLLHMREYSPNMAFAAGDELMENVISNGIGLTKIAEHLSKLKGTLGSNDSTIEGYTKQQSAAIKEGVRLLADAPNGIYKTSQYNKNQKEQMQFAYNYIVSMLPKNMKAILQINALNKGTTPEKIISSMLQAGASSSSKFEVEAITGKGSSKTGSDSGVNLDAATALITGKGYMEDMEFNTGTSYAVRVSGRHTEFQKHSGENMGQCTMDEALQSTLKGVLDFNKASFGGSRLNPSNYNHILINDGTVIGVDLPVGSDGNPDFEMLKKKLTLDLELLKQGIEDSSENSQQVNALCQAVGLPVKYTNDGKLNSYSWGRFAAFQATMDESALQNKNAILGDMVRLADSDTRDAYVGILQSRTATKKYDISDGWFGIGKDELYQGTVFVPVKANLVAATISSGQGISMEEATDVELKERGYDKDKAASYKPGYKPSDLK